MSQNYVEQIIKEFVEKIGVSYSGISCTEVAGQTVFCVETHEEKTLIGFRGETIRALDYLIKKITEKKGVELPYFLVDVNGYRTKHIQDIQNKAVIMAERARSFQYDVELTPMSSYERLIVHNTLSDIPDVQTESLGEGKERRIVIRYTKPVEIQ